MFPLYQWLPNVHLRTIKSVCVLVRDGNKGFLLCFVASLFGMFGAGFVFTKLKLDILLLVFGVCAMFVGSIAAIYQSNIKRLLAYSSVAQVGYMVLGLALLNQSGLTGGVIHLFNHALMKCALFLVVGCIALRLGSEKIEDFGGLMKKMPFTMWAFIVGGLSLIGVPGTVGFVSKWYLVLGTLELNSILWRS